MPGDELIPQPDRTEKSVRYLVKLTETQTAWTFAALTAGLAARVDLARVQADNQLLIHQNEQLMEQNGSLLVSYPNFNYDSKILHFQI